MMKGINLKFILSFRSGFRCNTCRHFSTRDKNRNIFSEVNTNVKLVVGGNGSKGNPRSFLLASRDNSYLFNCGEGTQRISGDHNARIPRLRNIFITRATWENTGGLPGLALTLDVLGRSSVIMHGPLPFDFLFDAVKYFGISTNLKVRQHDYSKGDFTDGFISVSRHILRASPQENDHQQAQLEPFCYICKFKSIPRKLSIKKCIELKIPKGPHLVELEKGRDVTLSDGRQISAADVLMPEMKCPVLVVIDCPSLDHIESLYSWTALHECVKESDTNCKPVMVHFTDEDVLTAKPYQEFLSTMSESVFHLALNESAPKLSCVGSLELQTQLNLIDDQVFPLKNNKGFKDGFTNNGVYFPKIGTSYFLLPENRRGLNYDKCYSYDEDLCRKTALSNSDFNAAVAEYKEKCGSLSRNGQKYPKITFLGTGSTPPSKRRNVSSILISIDSKNSAILDCGEGTYGQLVRFFGDDVEKELAKLNLIFVSHHHADHHLGLSQLLRKRSQVTSKKVSLILPNQVAKWLVDYDLFHEKISDLYTPFSQSELESPYAGFNSIGLNSLQCVRVAHCWSSYGIVISVGQSSPFKIVYSGDCIPTAELVERGSGCDVLIHEATLGADQEMEAAIKRHSTVKQAVEVGRRMQAKLTLLTHFSQRYSKIPLLTDDLCGRVMCAFDNMQVSADSIEKIPQLWKPVKTLFMDEYEMKLKQVDIRSVQKSLLRNLS